MALGKEIIAAVEAAKLSDRRVPVMIPYTNQVVYVRTVATKDFKALVKAMHPVNTRGDEGRAEAIGAIALCVDESGAPVWTMEDLPALMKFPIAILRKIWKVGQDLNGLSEDAQEDIKGNSDGTESDGSS